MSVSACSRTTTVVACSYLETRKRGKAQRVARPACANSTVHFLVTYRLLVPPGKITFKASVVRILPMCSHPPPANSPLDLRVYWTKIHEFFLQTYRDYRRC